MSEARIVFFDGGCGFCRGCVRFLVRRDAKRRFQFVSLGNPAIEGILAPLGIEGIEDGTVALLEGADLHLRSEAVLRVLAGLGGAWTLVRIFHFVPRIIRDALYNFVARRRHALPKTASLEDIADEKCFPYGCS